jgi:serine protease AprX
LSNGEYAGIAPRAKIVNLRVLDSEGKGKTSSVLNALDWVMTSRSKYNIRVVNMSLGCLAIDSYLTLCVALYAAW